MNDKQDIQMLIKKNRDKLSNALKRLEYSYNKAKQLPTSIDQLDDETLEVWESFSARFSRVIDMFLTKYIRSVIMREEPGFTGSLRDYVNQAEKLSLLEDPERWLEARKLRNIIAHEYEDGDLENYFKTLLREAPFLLSIGKRIPNETK